MIQTIHIVDPALRSQKETVLEHLKEKGDISAFEALLVYKITRLAARIYQLRLDGHKIRSVWDRDLAGTKYTRYELKRSR